MYRSLKAYIDNKIFSFPYSRLLKLRSLLQNSLISQGMKKEEQTNSEVNGSAVRLVHNIGVPLKPWNTALFRTRRLKISTLAV